MKNVIVRRFCQMLSTGQIQGVKIVAELGHIGHPDHIAGIVEEIQRQRGDHRVPHGALLFKKVAALAGAGAFLMPAAPFVDYQSHPTVRVKFLHGGTVVLDDFTHAIRLEKLLIPLLTGKVLRRSGRLAIVMRSKPPCRSLRAQLCTAFLHHPAGPCIVVSVCPAQDVLLFRQSQTSAYRGIAQIFLNAFFRRHMSAAAPVFIADSPIFHPEWFRRAVGGALIGKGGFSGRQIAVFHPVADAERRRRSHVGGNIGFCPDQTA